MTTSHCGQSRRPRTAQDKVRCHSALSAIYDPWVDKSARAFQKAAVGAYRGQTGLDVAAGTCVVYVDALRYDLAAAVCSPTVRARGGCGAARAATASRQPASRRWRNQDQHGWQRRHDAVDDQGRSVKGAVLRSTSLTRGAQFLDWDTAQVGDPAGTAWTQTNMIDSLGHSHGHQMADLIDHHLDLVAERVRALLDARGGGRLSWSPITAGFLRGQAAHKVNLPIQVTEGDAARKPRVARLKAAAARRTSRPLPWTWDSSVDMVSAPGAACICVGLPVRARRAESPGVRDSRRHRDTR